MQHTPRAKLKGTLGLIKGSMFTGGAGATNLKKREGKGERKREKEREKRGGKKKKKIKVLFR